MSFRPKDSEVVSAKTPSTITLSKVTHDLRRKTSCFRIEEVDCKDGDCSKSVSSGSPTF